MRTFDCERLDTTYFRLSGLGQTPRFSAVPSLIEFGHCRTGLGLYNFQLANNCFVIDNIETQLIRHIALFHAIKEDRTKLKQFCSIFFITLLHFTQYLIKNCCKKLNAKIEKVAIQNSWKQLKTLNYIYFEYLGNCWKL